MGAPAFSFVAGDGNLYLASLGDPRAQRLTWDWGKLQAAEGAERTAFAEEASLSPLRFRWPAWSPDGRSLYCVAGRREEEDGEETHYVIRPESAETEVLLQRKGGATIYACWSSDSERVAAMLLEDDAISLTALPPAGSRARPVRVARGLPLFAAWAPGDTRMIVAVGVRPGTQEAGSLLLCDAVTGEVSRKLHPRPGWFRAPAPHPDGDRVAFIAGGEGDQGRLVVASLRDGTLSDAGGVRGQTAMLWRPRRGGAAEELGLASSPRGPLGPFEILERVDDSGDRQALYRGRFLAFLWTPDGEAALICALTEDTGVLEWRLASVDEEDDRPLCRFRPAREQAVMLSFFDQYARSHPLVSPDSRHLLFAGAEASARGGGSLRAPLVYVVDLLGDGGPSALAEGTFAVWRNGGA